MTRQTVTTTTREYDEEGKLVKETTVTSVYDWPEPAPLTPYVAPYVQPYTAPATPWTYPTITWGDNTWSSASGGASYSVSN